MPRSGRRARPGAGVAVTLTRVVGVVLLSAVLVVAALAVVIPKVAGAVPLTILSNSMAPTMPVGSLAVVRPTMDTLAGPGPAMSPEEIDAVNQVDQIGVGDVIVFVPRAGSDFLVIHRVIAVSVASDGTRVFTTQGDNNSAVDDPVPSHQVRAVLWYHLPLLGYVNDKLNTDSRLPIAIGAAAVGYTWAAVLFVRAIRRRPATAARDETDGPEPQP